MGRRGGTSVAVLVVTAVAVAGAAPCAWPSVSAASVAASASREERNGRAVRMGIVVLERWR